MNEGQTHGIPIGPDASLVIAELLLSAVDQSLINKSPAIRGFRYVDDYELSFATLSDAEQMLTELQGLLAEYELNLNPRKTKVEELPKSLEDTWAVELGMFRVRSANSPVGQRNDLVSLFSRAFEIASELPHEPVLRYTVARLQSTNVAPKGWRTFQNCLLSAASADPATLPVVLGTLFQVATVGGHVVSISPLAEIVNSVISVHAPLRRGSEVAWALWGALAWKVPLSDSAGKLISAMDDDVVALLALHAHAKGLFLTGSLDLTEWSGMVNQPKVLQSEHWLLAYESNQQKWLSVPAVKGDPIFSAMSKAGVSFYNLSKATPQFPAAARGLPGGLLPNYYA